MTWKSKNCYEGNAEADICHEVSGVKKLQTLGVQESCLTPGCLCCAGLTHPGVYCMYFKIRNYIAKVLLEQAGIFSEPDVEFASFMGIHSDLGMQ